jgi:alpha-L-rhamnosidase
VLNERRIGTLQCAVRIGAASLGLTFFALSAAAQTGKPIALQCQSLSTPLGMDAKHPQLSWKLQDARDGARQTAYEIQVASNIKLLNHGKSDIWDSGRVTSDRSLGVEYAGPPLVASKRYYWRVLAWDGDGKPYPASDPTWWETGLLEQANWRAKWIGYEEPEERALRESGAAWITNGSAEVKAGSDTHHDFRLAFDAGNANRRAVLYVTGQDSAAAWVNARKVLEAEPLLKSGSMPWKKYRQLDVTKQIHPGRNLLALEVTHYSRPGGQPGSHPSQTPMSAVLVLVKDDGTVDIFKSGQPGWKAALNATGNWQEPAFDDSSWKDAVPFAAPREVFDLADTGQATRTGAVKSLRQAFDVKKSIAAARIYATAMGAYNLYVNGSRVGDHILAPGWTDFRQHVAYQAFDVTSQLKSGRNAVAALLAPGWYATPLGWEGQGFNYGKTPPALRAQLRIEYRDGAVEWIVTDESWRADVSPTLEAEIYDGETFDARKLQSSWNAAPFDDREWPAAQVVSPHEPQIEWQYFQPIREKQVLSAKSISNPSPGVYVFDFGQNLSGVARLRAQGAAGTDIRLRFGELLNSDGTLYLDNLRTAKVTDHFILAGNGVEEFQPAFTYHGFRYLEISGVVTAPKLEDVKAVVFHTDAPFTASLKTGNPMLNQLWSNILWGQRSNFVGVPTDCPQRDERLGWSADAQVFWRTAAYNMDLTAFSRKYSADLRGTQVGTDMYGIFAPGLQTPHPASGTGWSDAGVIVPWTSWIQTGDREIIHENWEGMERYLASIESANPDYLWKNKYGIPFADWLAPEGVTPVDLIATAYWAYDVTLMKQMAHAAGKTDDEKKYSALFEKIRAAFNKAYVHSDGFVGAVPPPPVFASGTETPLSDKPVETQTGYVLALHMNLLDDNLRKLAGQRLVDRIAANRGLLGTGFLGTPYLLGALTDTGHVDVAYRLLQTTQYPSWGYLVDHGATTMWERWNGDQMRGDPSMNSYNHYAYGAVADWIYRYAAGIDTVESDPGFHTIRLHPNFDRSLGNLDFSYDSGYGTIRSAWTVKNDTADWTLAIPPNAHGELTVSARQKRSFKLDGKALAENTRVHLLRQENSAEVYLVPAGSYTFSAATN